MPETKTDADNTVESSERAPITPNVYGQLLIVLAIAIVFEWIAIVIGDVFCSLLGQVLLVYVNVFLFPKRYRIGVGIFCVTLLAFFLLSYFGCPSLPWPFCRDTFRGADWVNHFSESAHFTNLTLAFVLVVFIIKSLVFMKSAQDA